MINEDLKGLWLMLKQTFTDRNTAHIDESPEFQQRNSYEFITSLKNMMIPKQMNKQLPWHQNIMGEIRFTSQTFKKFPVNIKCKNQGCYKKTKISTCPRPITPINCNVFSHSDTQPIVQKS